VLGCSWQQHNRLSVDTGASGRRVGLSSSQPVWQQQAPGHIPDRNRDNHNQVGATWPQQMTQEHPGAGLALCSSQLGRSASTTARQAPPGLSR
jgi:hypothetical protein